MSAPADPRPPPLPAWALGAIRDVLAHHPQVRAALVFGSRAKGEARPGSDVDLALRGDLSIAELARLAADLDACDLPWEVDLVRLDALEDEAVRGHIERVGVGIYAR